MEKRKWQLAFRRYVLEGTPSEAYAPYFGIDRVQLRKHAQLRVLARNRRKINLIVKEKFIFII